jgi:hypothetical protein
MCRVYEAYFLQLGLFCFALWRLRMEYRRQYPYLTCELVTLLQLRSRESLASCSGSTHQCCRPITSLSPHSHLTHLLLTSSQSPSHPGPLTDQGLIK